MATKDVSDFEVVWAADATWAARNAGAADVDFLGLLMLITGQPAKVCWRAAERASGRGYLDYGTSLRSAWSTPEGRALLDPSSPQ